MFASLLGATRSPPLLTRPISIRESSTFRVSVLTIDCEPRTVKFQVTVRFCAHETAPVARWFTPTNALIGTSTTEITNGVVSTVNSPTTPYVYGDITYDSLGNIQSVAGWAPTIVIDESPANVVGKVAEWDEDTRTLSVAYANGTFDVNEELVGADSNARWSVSSFDTLDMTDSFSENRQLEDEADDILDFTEKNPFGEFGNFTGSF